MKTIKFFLMMIGSFTSCIIYAQHDNITQDVGYEPEDIVVGERQHYSRTKKGFFAPSGLSLGIGYDYETLRFPDDDYSKKPLNGGRVSFLIDAPLGRLFSLENSIGMRYNHVKDTQLDNYYESLTRWDFGFHYGILLTTGYNFKKIHITVSGGALLDFCLDETTLTTYTGDKTEIGNIGYENIMTKLFDIPISFAATVRFMSLGLRVNYDIGTINRYNKNFYEQTGYHKDHTKKNSHLCISIQYYFKGL